jgi:hypothetical protein
VTADDGTVRISLKGETDSGFIPAGAYPVLIAETTYVKTTQYKAASVSFGDGDITINLRNLTIVAPSTGGNNDAPGGGVATNPNADYLTISNARVYQDGSPANTLNGTIGGTSGELVMGSVTDGRLTFTIPSATATAALIETLGAEADEVDWSELGAGITVSPSNAKAYDFQLSFFPSGTAKT